MWYNLIHCNPRDRAPPRLGKSLGAAGSAPPDGGALDPPLDLDIITYCDIYIYIYIHT